MRAFGLMLLVACTPPPPAAAPLPPTTDSADEGRADDSVAAEPSDQPNGSPASGPPILIAHNRLRAGHCAAPLVWSEELVAVAAGWAEQLVRAGCAFEHNPNTRFGENLAFFAPPGSVTEEGVAEDWYAEREQYDYRAAQFSMEAGHFTQVVWAGTRQLGCASARCGGGVLWVCNYAPAGNVIGEFRRNVSPARCR